MKPDDKPSRRRATATFAGAPPGAMRKYLYGLRQVANNLGGNNQDPVLICMNEVPWIDDHSTHFDRNSNLSQVNIGMRDDDSRSEEVEAETPHLVQVAHATVGDRSHT